MQRMKFSPALLVCLLALQSCSLQEHLDKTVSRLETQFTEIRQWEQLPLRTISWSPLPRLLLIMLEVPTPKRLFTALNASITG